MQSRILTYVTAMLSYAALAAPVPVAAQAQQEPNQQSHYRVLNLGQLGGTFSSGNGVNDLGWVMGSSELPGNTSQHAALWRYGLTALDLGTLGGPNSSVIFPSKNNLGKIEGVSDTTTPDPAGENFCGFGSGFTCEGVVWQDNVINALPNRLGGNNWRAAGINDWGQVVGWAENTTVDPTCISPAVFQYEPVVWGPRKGEMQQLPTYPGDPDGAAVAINDFGQVVGISGPCGDDDGMGARHAVLWQNGTVTNLGNFGGQYFNTAAAINARGQIAGWSDLANDTALCTPACHAFLWTKSGGLRDLGVLPGDQNSLAYGINDQGQVVGQSIDAAGNSRAFIWQNGTMTDLNTLTAPGSPYLLFAGDINDEGEITGETFDQSNGTLGPAYLAVPTFDKDVKPARNPQKVILPERVRQQLRQHLGLGRLGGGSVTPQ
jgi:probable HAF family extracellular repeat protein